MAIFRLNSYYGQWQWSLAKFTIDHLADHAFETFWCVELIARNIFCGLIQVYSSILPIQLVRSLCGRFLLFTDSLLGLFLDKTCAVSSLMSLSWFLKVIIVPQNLPCPLHCTIARIPLHLSLSLKFFCGPDKLKLFRQVVPVSVNQFRSFGRPVKIVFWFEVWRG